MKKILFENMKNCMFFFWKYDVFVKYKCFRKWLIKKRFVLIEGLYFLLYNLNFVFI